MISIEKTIEKWKYVISMLGINPKYYEKIALYSEQHMMIESQSSINGISFSNNSTLHLALKTLSKIENLDNVIISTERYDTVCQSLTYDYDTVILPNFIDICNHDIVEALSKDLNQLIFEGKTININILFNKIDRVEKDFSILHNYKIS